ncbi:hypothetical protein Bca4012_047643 [Brassica carinata]
MLSLEKQRPESSSSEEAQAVTPWVVSDNVLVPVMLIIFHPPRNAENGRLSKWFHQKQHTNPNTMRNPKRKDKERVERARVHSAVSIAALAAGLASVTSSESCSKESGSMMTLALASATELLASHCIEMAEQAGADRECVAATVRFWLLKLKAQEEKREQDYASHSFSNPKAVHFHL